MIHYLYRYFGKDIYLHHAIDRQPSNSDYSMHTHNNCEILGCIRGKGKYIVEGSEYQMEPGRIFVMRPMETHKLYVNPDEPYERIMVNFSYDLIRKIDPKETLLTIFKNRSLGQHNLYHKHEFRRIPGLELMKGMVAPAETREEQQINAVVNLYMLINSLKTIFIEKSQSEAMSGNMSMRQDTPRLIIDYINEHLHENLSLDALSERFYLSKSQISRIFKKATGSSVLDYITIKRLMQAREYMMDGKSAGEACQLCGFDHYSSFYRAYKKRFNVSPSAEKADKAANIYSGSD